MATSVDITKRKQAEAALRESEARLRAIAGVAPVGIFHTDADGDVTYVNEKWCQLGGLTSEAAMGKGWLKAIHPDDRKRVSSNWYQVTNTTKHFENEYQYVNSDGVITWCFVQTVPIFDEAGDVIGYVGALTDITERKRFEKALQESEAQLRDAIDSIPEGFVLYDADERFVYCNNRYRDFYPSIANMLKPGARLEDLARTAYEAGDIRGSAEKVEARIEQRLTRYRTAQGSHEQQLKDGRWLLCGDRHTSTGGITCIRTEITERKQLEEELHRSESRYRAIAGVAPVGIFHTDADGDVTFVNEKWCQLGGMTAEAAMGKGWLKALHPDDRKLVSSSWYNAAKNNEHFENEYRYVNADGVVTWCFVQALPEFDKAGDVIGHVGALTDITARKLAEEALRESEARLKDAQRIAKLGHSIWDEKEDREVYSSAEALRIFGVSPDRISSTLEEFLTLVHPDDRERVKAVMERAKKDRSGFEIEYKIVRPDGETRHVHEVAELELDESSEPLRTISALQDITERKRVEEALHEAHESLERKVEERTRALKGSEGRYRAIAGVAPVGIFHTDAGGYVTYVNEKWCQLGGMTSEAAIGKGWLKAIHPDDRERVSSNWYQMADASQHFENEYRYVNSDGVITWCFVQALPEKDEAGDLIGYVGALTDITERKRAEDALRESEARLSDAIESFPGGFILYDAEERLILCNNKYREFYPSIVDMLEPGAMLEDVIRASFEADTVQGSAEDDEGVWMKKRLRQYRMTLEAHEQHLKDGRWLLSSESKTSDGGTVGIRTDITEVKRTEEAIRTRDAWLRGILDSTPIQIVLKDTEGRIMAISQNVATDLGLSQEDFIGHTMADFLPADIAEIYMAGDRKVIETGENVQQEVTVERDGKTKHYLNAKFPLKNDAGKTIGICGMTIDMTELKDLEAQLRNAHRMEAVGQLTGGIAHDFNNLLQIMVGNAGLLQIRIGEDEVAGFCIDEIHAAVKSGAALTGRLLAFSRQQTLSPTALDVTVLVDGLEDMLRRTLGETIDLRVERNPNLWSAMIDPHQFENALINLCINARDATPNGGRLGIETGNVTLDETYTEQYDEVKPGDYVMVVVSDTGTGMSPEIQEKIFEPFFTTKEVGKGSGLGLSMVYGFVKQSGGHITIDSEVGRGTTFTLFLPRSEEAVEKRDAKHDTSQAARGLERILIVEDDESVRRVPVFILRDRGYDVVEAGDGKEAIDQLKKGQPFDLLFSDVVLPGGMNGIAIAEEAKRIQPGIKVLFATGYTESSGVRLDKLDPGVKLLNKPYHPSMLLETVRDLLDGKDN